MPIGGRYRLVSGHGQIRAGAVAGAPQRHYDAGRQSFFARMPRRVARAAEVQAFAVSR